MADQGQLRQVQAVEEGHEQLSVVPGQVVVAGGAAGQAEPRKVQGDAPEPVPQGNNDFAVHEGPDRIAVQHQQNRPRTLVDVVHDVPVQRHEAAFEREQLVVHPRRTFAYGLRSRHAPILLDPSYTQNETSVSPVYNQK
jgi:hypothetical protein